MPFTKVALLSEVPVGSGKQVAVGGRTIAVFNDDGKVYAVDDACPHRGAPLSEGMCKSGQVVCPWHAARFDLATGEALCPPARSGVQSFAVHVVGDEIQVDV